MLYLLGFFYNTWFPKESNVSNNILSENLTNCENHDSDNDLDRTSTIGVYLPTFPKPGETKVERRSSDVTLERFHAGERRENESICASLKRYQTLPPKASRSSLVSNYQLTFICFNLVMFLASLCFLSNHYRYILVWILRVSTSSICSTIRSSNTKILQLIGIKLSNIESSFWVHKRRRVLIKHKSFWHNQQFHH